MHHIQNGLTPLDLLDVALRVRDHSRGTLGDLAAVDALLARTRRLLEACISGRSSAWLDYAAIHDSTRPADDDLKWLMLVREAEPHHAGLRQAQALDARGTAAQ